METMKIKKKSPKMAQLKNIYGFWQLFWDGWQSNCFQIQGTRVQIQSLSIFNNIYLLLKHESYAF